jgi:serine phosphatase RsbU (regulator of sigma subunit)
MAFFHLPNMLYFQLINILMKLIKLFLLGCLCLLSFEIQAQVDKILSSDSLLFRAHLVYQNNPDQAFTYSKRAIERAKLENSELNLGKAYDMLGVSLDYLGELDSALFYFDLAIDIFKTQKDPSYLAKVYTSKANSLCLLNKNKEALSYYVKSYDIFKSVKSGKQSAAALMGIGNVYSTMKSYDLCLKYYDQALSYFLEVKDSTFISYIYTNISEVYASMNDVNKELEFQRKSLSIKEKLNDDYGLVYSYSNMSGLMAKQSKEDSALYFANKSIEKSIKINNQEFLTTSYKALADVYFHFKNYKQAVDVYGQALNIARKLKNSKSESTILKLLANAQLLSGDYVNGSNSLLEFIDLNDSINNIETLKSFNELQTQYETDKKEKEISLLNERDKKREIVIYSIIGLSLLLGLLSFVLFNRFRLKKRAANELEIRNNEISNQKHIIEEKQKEITDSIHYAKRIQNTLLAHKDFIDKFIPQNFILFKPKDIVSGDFYWATEHNNKFYLAVCDSTGHGVPGAFMSLLNIGFLSEAIKEKNISRPNEIFNYVRKRLTESIGSDGQKDGMDAILVCIDTNTKSINYAAANNEPVLLKNGNYIKLAKDKMPVGQGELIADFTLHTIDYETGDTLYLYTDGYADQFGGPKGKKFKYKALNDLLESIHHLPMQEQHHQLNQTIANWMGDLEQVDDICIVGIRL